MPLRRFLALLLLLPLTATVLRAEGVPVLESRDSALSRAFELALRTVEGNIRDGVIMAGGDYGGEWTRDAAINAWNAGSLIFPNQTRNSLWAVTLDGGKTIGHQYWDKIIWVPCAFNHCLVTGDAIEPVYRCSASTMEELERTAYDTGRGLFNGPSVFNDGIAGYEAPIPDDTLRRSGAVYHPNTAHISCLSTNCVYHMAYMSLSSMAWNCGEPLKAASYRIKALKLRRAIRIALYDKEEGRLYYLVDHNGDIHRFQEALGYSFAILGGVVSRKEARSLVEGATVSEYGITSIYPDFKRFDREHPGRHNNMVWPFVNAFWAEAALKSGDRDKFENELRNLARLALNGGMFYEIYNPCTGEPDGGWQLGLHWQSCRNQTWSATGYLRMVVGGVFGLGFGRHSMTVAPDVEAASELGCTALRNLRYRHHDVDIIIAPSTDKRKGTYVNGIKVRQASVPCDGSESYEIVIYR